VAAEIAAQGKPVLRARLQPDQAQVASLRGKRVLAFAGIGRPDKFFATVEAVGAEIVERRGFPDHHPYTPAEIEALRGRAAAAGATLLTTAKDAVRLPASARAAVRVLPVRLAWEEPAVLDALLAPALHRSETA
jgi:tetraacyldisaccharide 4'-kinase